MIRAIRRNDAVFEIMYESSRISKEWLLRDKSTPHRPILPWSQVFRITRGRNPWNTLDDEHETLPARAGPAVVVAAATAAESRS